MDLSSPVLLTGVWLSGDGPGQPFPSFPGRPPPLSTFLHSRFLPPICLVSLIQSSTLAMTQIPQILPSLPPATGLLWSAEVTEAHRGLTSAFKISRAALNLDESDPVRLGHHLQHAKTFMLSIVEVLGHQTANPLPSEYIEDLYHAVSSLVDGLQSALNEATAAFVTFSLIYLVSTDHLLRSEGSRVSRPKVIAIQKSGRRGRPRKVISEAFLKEAFRPGRNISVSKLATSLPIHRNTLRAYMSSYKIKRRPFSTISDSSLDVVVKRYKDSHPNTGIRYLRGYLFQQGIRIQRQRIIASLSRVDNVAKVILRHKIIKRREYKSSRPNALWHVDGHHKLGPWGIVIHGLTDGYDRLVNIDSIDVVV